MEDLLKYYYNFDNITFLDNNIFVSNNDYFYLLVENDNKLNINYINYVLEYIKKPNNYFEIIKNKEGKYFFNKNGSEFLVLLTKGILKENVLLNEMIINNLKYRYYKDDKDLNITHLWSKKIDYLEYQISQISKDKIEIINSFSFFVGLAENAISFININNINFNNCHKAIVHTRINYPEKVINYYNPINLIIDYEIRDYAEYIKSKILLNDDINNDIKYILNNANLSDDDIKLFYARLMFPTLYFDEIESILLDGKEEKNIEIFIERIGVYLNTLKDVYYEIDKHVKIIIPKWIKI